MSLKDVGRIMSKNDKKETLILLEKFQKHIKDKMEGVYKSNMTPQKTHEVINELQDENSQCEKIVALLYSEVYHNK